MKLSILLCFVLAILVCVFAENGINHKKRAARQTQSTDNLTKGTGDAAGSAGQGTGKATGDVGSGTGDAAGKTGGGAGGATNGVGDGAGGATKGATKTR